MHVYLPYNVTHSLKLAALVQLHSGKLITELRTDEVHWQIFLHAFPPK